MAMIKLNRINKGGEIILNSDHILFIEIDSRVTTVHMTNNLLFSVVETLDGVYDLINQQGAKPNPA
jgi:uncharacterized protein YlzI (FlbEa/FlbD family)